MVYTFTVHGYEGYTFQRYLNHESKTRDEFETDVYNLLILHGENYINSSDQYIGNDDWCEYILPFLFEMGYSETNIEGIVFSEIGIIEEGRRCYAGEQWLKVVGEDLYNSAVEKNNELRDRDF